MISHGRAIENSYALAARMAAEAEIWLSRPTDGVFQVRKDDWILDIYPRGSGGRSPRIRRSKGNAPYLALPERWNLVDIIKAVSGATP